MLVLLGVQNFGTIVLSTFIKGRHQRLITQNEWGHTGDSAWEIYKQGYGVYLHGKLKEMIEDNPNVGRELGQRQNKRRISTFTERK